MLELLYKALHSPCGVVVETNDVEKLRQQLYRARKGSGDEALKDLSLRPSPSNPHGELWIIKKVNEDGTSHNRADD